LPDEALEQAEVILGSVHRVPDGMGNLISVGTLPFEEAAAMEFRFALGMVKHAPIHVLAHPGGMCLRAFGRFPEEYWRELMHATLTRGIAIEINASYLQKWAG
jgi:putative hydrolase